MDKIGRLYSRKNGWKESETIKCFHSSLMENLPEDYDMQEKSGITILNYLHKNNLQQKYEELYNNCKTYSNWYFYYGELVEITQNSI